MIRTIGTHPRSLATSSMIEATPPTMREDRPPLIQNPGIQRSYDAEVDRALRLALMGRHRNGIETGSEA